MLNAMNPMQYSISYSKEHKFAIHQAMCDLDDKIVQELFPNDKEYSSEGRDVYTGYLWLKSNIATLFLMQGSSQELVEKIESIIKESPYADVILNEFIHLDEIIEEVEIRRDFAAALKSVKVGRDLAPRIGYALSDADVRSLALLHKAGKFRKKIESLLTDCNFHYECGKFFRGDYDEFLIVSEG